jgi:hypothetical protein
MYAELALLALLLTKGCRQHDLLITGLLAFGLIPKREMLFTFMGGSDSDFDDASIAIILNPACILLALVYLLRDGWRIAQPFQLGDRVRKLTGILLPTLKCPPSAPLSTAQSTLRNG